MNDPQIWWFVTRSSAILAWILLTLSVVWGILLSTRVARRVDSPAWLQDVHRHLSGVALVLVGLHVGSLLLDPFINMSFLDILVPGASRYRPLAVGLGIVAMYLLIAVYLSSLIHDRMPRRAWKGIHYASYAVVLGVAFHAGWSGTDVTELWYRVVAGVLIGLTAFAVVLRLLSPKQVTVRTAIANQSQPNTAVLGSTKGDSIGGHLMAISGRQMLVDGIVRIDLRAADAQPLPLWQPGDHINLQLPNGLSRQYSLCGDPADLHTWSIAVRRGDRPDGGSSWIHKHATVGVELMVNGPAHTFPLIPAHEYLFIAAGIGITPIRAMIQSLPAHREWKLIYLGRQRSDMAFADELMSQYPGRVDVWESHVRGGHFDFTSLQLAPSVEVYACGPEPILNALQALLPEQRLHIERFIAENQRPRDDARPFTVECRKSDLRFEVSAEHTMLETLESHGLPVLASCREGICGNCEVRVLTGEPEHHDRVLPDETKDELGVMYPCVSRSRSDVLVIDV